MMGIQKANIVTLHKNLIRGHGVRTEHTVSICLSNGLKLWIVPRSEYASEAQCHKMLEALRTSDEFRDAQYEEKLEGQR